MVDASSSHLPSTSFAVTVSHAWTSHVISLPAATSTTVDGLREDIAALTGVEPLNQKLIYRGKTLPRYSTQGGSEAGGEALPTLQDLGVVDGSKLTLIGSKTANLNAFIDESTQVQRRYHVTSTREGGRVRRTPDGPGGKMVMDLTALRRSGGNAYGRIEVLPGCPHEDARRERLRKLSQDEAVLDCMKRREWTVGLLTELHPHRDPTLLGLNKNAGEAVYLRLLTDDLSGLRPYFHTRMVLLHELTHNKHGDHDEAFKTLNSLLNKEVKAFEEAKRAGAHRLGGEIEGAFEVEEQVVEQMCGSAHTPPSGKTTQNSGTSTTLPSRRSEENGAYEIEQRRQAMLRAAEERAKKQNR